MNTLDISISMTVTINEWPVLIKKMVNSIYIEVLDLTRLSFLKWYVIDTQPDCSLTRGSP